MENHIESKNYLLTFRDKAITFRQVQVVLCARFCYDNYINLALGCGHTLCDACCNEYFHRSVLGSMDRHITRRDIYNRPTPSQCPFCRKFLRCKYINTVTPQEVEGNLFFTRCLDEECFMNSYAVEGIMLKIL